MAKRQRRQSKRKHDRRATENERTRGRRRGNTNNKTGRSKNDRANNTASKHAHKQTQARLATDSKAVGVYKASPNKTGRRQRTNEHPEGAAATPAARKTAARTTKPKTPPAGKHTNKQKQARLPTNSERTTNSNGGSGSKARPHKTARRQRMNEHPEDGAATQTARQAFFRNKNDKANNTASKHTHKQNTQGLPMDSEAVGARPAATAKRQRRESQPTQDRKATENEQHPEDATATQVTTQTAA
jgi:hypothetical protein